MPKQKLYNELNNTTLSLTLDSGERVSLKLEVSKNRRCFKLYQSAKVGTKDFDYTLQEHLEQKLDKKQHYFERIFKVFPRSDYLLLDAMALEQLIKEGGVKIATKPVEKAEKMRADLEVISTEEAEEKAELQRSGFDSVHERVWKNENGQ